MVVLLESSCFSITHCGPLFLGVPFYAQIGKALGPPCIVLKRGKREVSPIKLDGEGKRKSKRIVIKK